MRCLAICQSELAVRILDSVLPPNFDVDFLTVNHTLARRLQSEDISIAAADVRRTDTYLKVDLSPTTCVIVEDNGRQSLKKVLQAIRDAGGTLVYVLDTGVRRPGKREEQSRQAFPEITRLSLAELFGGPLLT